MSNATAPRLTGISSMATRALLAGLGAAYEARSGVAVAIRSVGGIEAVRLVRAGEALDLVVLASPVMEALEREGHLLPDSRMDLVRSSMAVAVPQGSPRPTIGDEAAVRDAIMAARRICFSTGPSGDRLMQMLERWGLTEALAGRLSQAPPGVPVGTLLADGRPGIGFQQMSELIDVPGIEIVGALPPDLDAITVFTAGIAATTAAGGEARSFLDYLASAETESAKERCGFQLA